VSKEFEAANSKISSIFGKRNQNEFEIRETKSSINGFTKQYAINGIDGVDAESFLAAARPQVVGLWEASEEQKSLWFLHVRCNAWILKTAR